MKEIFLFYDAENLIGFQRPPGYKFFYDSLEDDIIYFILFPEEIPEENYYSLLENMLCTDLGDTYNKGTPVKWFLMDDSTVSVFWDNKYYTFEEFYEFMEKLQPIK